MKLTRNAFKVNLSYVKTHARLVHYSMPEPEGPCIVSEKLPGPNSVACKDELSHHWDTRAVNMMTDYDKSVGNYIVDADGNTFLDVYSQIASVPVGYNNLKLRNLAQSKKFATWLANRPALGNFPFHDLGQTLANNIMKHAPIAHDKVHFAMCGASGNEAAFKLAFMYKFAKQHGGRGPEIYTEEDLSSCMNNQEPGSPKFSVLSFKKGFHGRLLGALSTTRSKPVHKLGFPAFDWPQAEFPNLKFPLEDNMQANAEEEQRCLQNVEELIKTWKEPVAAVIVEPILSEGGDLHASPAFFQGLQKLCKKHDVIFICDEVQTGVGSTGKFWAHEHFNLPFPPDIVTFAKKFLCAGYFYGREDLIPDMPYRQFGTWLGDPVRILLTDTALQEIDQNNLVEQVRVTGQYLYTNLQSLSAIYPTQISNLRGEGRGTFISWDMPSAKSRDEFIQKMKLKGVNMGGCGAQSIRLRPMLTFEEKHADILLSKLQELLEEIAPSKNLKKNSRTASMKQKSASA